jgi:3-deoxy-D-manno-octulosonate 8-phosphate phosphatase (KDO 8-P phosphatase)
MQDILARAAKIRLAIFDVDGALTDGKLYFDGQGGEYKGFHARDGLGIALLQESGVEVAVISGRACESVSRRMESLNIRRAFLGWQDKLAALDQLREEVRVELDEIAHVGDDLLDLPLMRRVGLAVAVADAHASILPFAHWRTVNPGGGGAAREVCDLILEAQGKLRGIVERYY